MSLHDDMAELVKLALERAKAGTATLEEITNAVKAVTPFYALYLKKNGVPDTSPNGSTFADFAGSLKDEDTHDATPIRSRGRRADA